MSESEGFVPSSAPRRVLALDWYDGAKAGLAEYDGYPNAFQFELSTSTAEEPKAFLLRTSPLSRLDELDGVLKPLGQPRLPVWRPVWQFQTEEEKNLAETAVAAATPSSPVVAVIVADRIQDPPILVRIVATIDDRASVARMNSSNAGLDEWIEFCQSPSAG